MADTKVIDGENQGNPGEKRKNYKPLTFKQEKFCEGLVMGMSQVEAYKNAYNTDGYNGDAGLMVHASRLAADARVVLRVATLRVPAQEEFQKHRKAWLFELMCMAMVDPASFFDTHGNPLDIPSLPEANRKMLAGFEICEEFTGKGDARQSVGYVRKFKMLSKLEALKLFGESLGWLGEKGMSKFGVKAEVRDKDRVIKIELVSAKESA